MEHAENENDSINREYLVPLGGGDDGPSSPSSPPKKSTFMRMPKRMPSISRLDSEKSPIHTQSTRRPVRTPSLDSYGDGSDQLSISSREGPKFITSSVGAHGSTTRLYTHGQYQGTRLMFDGSIQPTPRNPKNLKLQHSSSYEYNEDINTGASQNSGQEDIRPIIIWNITLPLSFSRYVPLLLFYSILFARRNLCRL